MIPMSDVKVRFVEDKTETQPTKTWKVYSDLARISGAFDDLPALVQSIKHRLTTPRGVYKIYSDAYGIDIISLADEKPPLLWADLANEIRNTLAQDDRVTGADGFIFEQKGKTDVCAAFTVYTIYGPAQISEVDLNV